MNKINTLKLAIHEAHAENIINSDKRDSMLTFCESVDLENAEDYGMFMEMTQELINIAEAKKTNELKLTIFESEACGDITAEEREELLKMF